MWTVQANSEELRRRNCQAVVITYGSVAGGEQWRREAQCQLPVLIDLHRQIYAQLGFKKSTYGSWSTESLLFYATQVSLGTIETIYGLIYKLIQS